MPYDVEYIQRILRDKALIGMDRTFEYSTALEQGAADNEDGQVVELGLSVCREFELMPMCGSGRFAVLKIARRDSNSRPPGS